MNIKYLTEPIEKIFTFSGRTSKKAYWMFYLFNLLIIASFILIIVFFSAINKKAGNIALTILSVPIIIYALIQSFASFSLFIRRLHDTNKSGWYYLLNFVPFGNIVLLIFSLETGDVGANDYGEDPEQIEFIEPEPIKNNILQSN